MISLDAKKEKLLELFWLNPLEITFDLDECPVEYVEAYLICSQAGFQLFLDDLISFFGTDDVSFYFDELNTPGKFTRFMAEGFPQDVPFDFSFMIDGREAIPCMATGISPDVFKLSFVFSRPSATYPPYKNDITIFPYL